MMRNVGSTDKSLTLFHLFFMIYFYERINSWFLHNPLHFDSEEINKYSEYLFLLYQLIGKRTMNKKEQVFIRFRDVFNKMSWLNELKMKDRLKNYKPSEVHCIEYIEKNKNSNVTTLAESFYMTRGAISKLTKKLIHKGLIESYQKSDNRKEVYFRLTKKGKEVYEIHEKLHNEFQERDKVIFAQITDEQFDNMLILIDKYSRHLDAEIKDLNTNANSE